MFASQDPWQAPAAPAAPGRSGAAPLAVASVVIGVISLPLMFCCCMALPMPMLGAGLGAYAWMDARNRGDSTTLPIIGTLLNGVSVLFVVGLMVVGFAGEKYKSIDDVMAPPEVFEEFEEFEQVETVDDTREGNAEPGDSAPASGDSSP